MGPMCYLELPLLSLPTLPHARTMQPLASTTLFCCSLLAHETVERCCGGAKEAKAVTGQVLVRADMAP